MVTPTLNAWVGVYGFVVTVDPESMVAPVNAQFIVDPVQSSEAKIS